MPSVKSAQLKAAFGLQTPKVETTRIRQVPGPLYPYVYALGAYAIRFSWFEFRPVALTVPIPSPYAPQVSLPIVVRLYRTNCNSEVRGRELVGPVARVENET